MWDRPWPETCCLRQDHDHNRPNGKKGWHWTPDLPERNRKGHIIETRAQKIARELENQREFIIWQVYGEPYEPVPVVVSQEPPKQWDFPTIAENPFISAIDIVSVQPMTSPLGLVFLLDYAVKEKKENQYNGKWRKDCR